MIKNTRSKGQTTEAQKQLKKAQQANLKAAFETLWQQLGGPPLLPEYQFHPQRRYRFDYAFIRPELRCGIEIEGGTWSGGRHTRGQGYAKDCQKYNLASLMGFRVFRLTSDMLTQREGPIHLEPIIKLLRSS